MNKMFIFVKNGKKWHFCHFLQKWHFRAEAGGTSLRLVGPFFIFVKNVKIVSFDVFLTKIVVFVIFVQNEIFENFFSKFHAP